MEAQAVIISGGMGGIGKAAALAFAERGWQVCVLYHQTASDEAEAFAQTLGDGHLALPCDITDPQATASAVMRAKKRFGRLDAAIHAAVGPLLRVQPTKMTTDQFKSQFEVTVFGGFNFFKAAVGEFHQSEGGSLLGITSAALQEHAPAMSAYLCAKAALKQLLYELHAELAPRVRVNAVAPAFVPTSLHADLPAPVLHFMKERLPNQTTPEAVAQVIFDVCTSPQRGLSFSVPSAPPVAL